MDKNSEPDPRRLTTEGPLNFDHIAWELDWNLLRTFIVIAQKKSISKAAQHMQLKQPTISNALKRLENQLGCQLVDRGPRKFEMTRHGAALYLECKEIFGSIGRLPNIIQDSHNDLHGHIKILMASHVMTPILDETLREFHKKNPKATFSISVMSSHEVVDATLAKQATLGICLIREKQEALKTQLFYREYFGFFCGPNHPLFGKENISLSDLQGHKRVTFNTDKLGDVLHPLAVLRGQAQLSDKVTGVSNNLEEVRRMIMAGLGIGPLPVHVVERDIINGRLWRVLPSEKSPVIDVFTIQNPKAILNAAEKEFVKMLDQKIVAIPLSERTYGDTQSL